MHYQALFLHFSHEHFSEIGIQEDKVSLGFIYFHTDPYVLKTVCLDINHLLSIGKRGTNNLLNYKVVIDT